jgi:unsaturated rhamnogalacturonyl hydrolase
MLEAVSRREFIKTAATLTTGCPPLLAADPANAANPKQLVKTVADAVLRDFPKPPRFDWGEGVMLAGMMQAYQLIRDRRYLNFVGDFANHWHKKGIGPTLEKRGYCGHWGPGLALLMLHETTGHKPALDLVNRINDFMLHKAERTGDGGLSHFNGKPQLWVDTLHMCCPILSHSARITNRPKLQQEAVRQLEIFAKHLRDPATGLFYHMWDQQTARHTPEFWARGNGWVAMSYAEVLINEEAGSPTRARLTKPLAKLLATVAALQDKTTGLWHTILDAPDTYLEASASGMFLYAMAQCRNGGLIDIPYHDAMAKAWEGLAETVDPEGSVTQVSAGTGPSDKAGYIARKRGTYTWGTGAFLLAAAAHQRAKP